MNHKHTWAALLSATIAASPLPLFAADDHAHAKPTTHAEADGHDHAKPAAHADGDGHDHGASHAEEAHADEVTLTAEAIAASGIKIETAAVVTLSATLDVPARVALNEEAVAHIGSPVTGRAIELKAKVGTRASKGDALVIVESPELGEAQSDLLQKRTALSVARSTTQPARESLDRAKSLFAQNEGIALAEVQRRQADLVGAEGAVQTATSAATAAENKLRLLGMDDAHIASLIETSGLRPQFALRAPIAGTILKRDVTQGEIVRPDMDALLVIADLSTLWIWADVPEASLNRVAIGSRSSIHAAGLGDAIEGNVSFVAPQINEDTRTGRVRIDVSNADGALRAGMFARATITLGGGDHAGAPVLAVPSAAVQIVEGKPAVFVPVKGEPNTFAKREVRVAAAVNGMVPILEGLTAGEPFVAAGSFVLKADLGKAGAAHEH